jgi:hypothetical protein
MEVLGRSLPSLTPAIFSGLDSLTEGIAKSTKSAGASALDQAIDMFSADNMGSMGIAWGKTAPSAIGGEASFPGPGDFLSQMNSTLGSKQTFLDIQAEVQDPKFNQSAALASSMNNLFGGQGIVDNLIGRDGLLAEALGGVAFPPAGEEPIPGADRGIILTGGKAFGDPVGDRGIILTGGKSFGDPIGDPGSDRGIILTGGKAFGDPAVDPGSDRGIILTGGKALGDPEASQGIATTRFLPAIDQSLRQLTNLNPYTSEGKETLSIFQQQLTILNRMEGTVRNQSALLQQMSHSLKGKITG